jgi:hypothetical protein
MNPRAPKNETPSKWRALHVSPSKGNRLANGPSAKSLSLASSGVLVGLRRETRAGRWYMQT